jgi:hypothetical protein
MNTTIAPAYAVLYPIMAEKAQEFGYALSIHGSMVNDFDLVAIPWVEEAGSGEELVKALVKYLDLFVTPMGVQANPEKKPHGRTAWHLTFENSSGVKCYIDLSVLPRR